MIGPDSKKIIVIFTPEVRKIIETRAKANYRTMAAEIRMLVDQALALERPPTQKKGDKNA